LKLFDGITPGTLTMDLGQPGTLINEKKIGKL